MKESVCPFSLQTTNNTIALCPFLMTHVHVFTYKDGSPLLSLSSDIQREHSYYYIFKNGRSEEENITEQLYNVGSCLPTNTFLESYFSSTSRAVTCTCS